MLHTETVEAGTLDLIKRLMADNQLQDFFMVGGTALSLLIGHRISIDIDLFTERNFDSGAVKRYLEQSFKMTDTKTIGIGVCCFGEQGINICLNQDKKDLEMSDYKKFHSAISNKPEFSEIYAAGSLPMGNFRLHY